jgi:hypothetical protein
MDRAQVFPQQVAPGIAEENALREANFGEPEIEAWRQETVRSLSDGGFKQSEIDDYFGRKPVDNAPIKTMMEQNKVAALAAEKPAAPSSTPAKPADPPSFVDDFMKTMGLFGEGMKDSATGQTLNFAAGRAQDHGEVPVDPEWYQRLMYKAGALAPDLPLMAAAGSAGTSLGVPVGAAVGSLLLPGPGTVIGGVVGGLTGGSSFAFMAPAGLRKIVTDYYQKGGIKDFKDFWERSFETAIEMGKEGIVGTLTGAAGLLTKSRLAGASPVAQAAGVTAAEVITMVNVGSALHAQFPTYEEFLDAALLVGGGQAIGVLPNVMEHFVKTGKRPAELALEAQTNPALRQQLLAENSGKESYAPGQENRTGTPAPAADPLSRGAGAGGAGGPGQDGSPLSTGPGGGRKEQKTPRLRQLPDNSPGPTDMVQEASARYLKRAGLPERRASEFVKADPERGTRIAQAYEEMPHAPNDPAVKASYDALIKETLEQFQDVKQMGIEIEMIQPGMANPYPEGHRQMIEDVRNGHLWFFPTEQGFGTEVKITDHPLLVKTGETMGDYTLLANDVFRIVHDVFGHAKEGVSFGKHGEENAWQTHARMYSDLAVKAMTTETRGQNSWVNFGPKGKENQANPGMTSYADQKAGLLPDWVIAEGLGRDRIGFEAMPGTKKFQAESEARFGEIIQEADLDARYEALKDSEGGHVIDTDVYRQLSPDYSASKDGATAHVAATHRPASAAAHERYFRKLKEPSPKDTPERKAPVLLMAGGGGAGKSTMRKNTLGQINEKSALVFDGTFSRIDSSLRMIEAALKEGREVVVAHVYRPLGDALSGTAGRFDETGRFVPAQPAVEAHVNSLEVAIEVAKKYEGDPRVQVVFIENLGPGKEPRQLTLEEIAKKRYIKDGETAQQAIERLLPEAKEALHETEQKAQAVVDRFDAEHSRRTGGAGAGGRGSDGGNAQPPGGRESKILDRIGRPEERKFSLSLDELYTKAVDDLHPLKLFEEAARGKTELEPKASPYTLARLTRGSYAKADQFLNLSPFKFKTLKNIPGSKSFKKILEPVKDDLDGFREYALAKRALELHSRGIETGIPLEDATAVSKAGTSKYDKIWREMQDYQDHGLQYLRDSGILSEEAYLKMKEANQDFVPFYRVMETEQVGPAGRKLTVKNPVKKIKGSDRLIIDPLESIIKNTYAFITLAERNRVMTAMLELSQKAEGGEALMKKVPARMRPVEVSADEIGASLKGLGIDAKPEDLTIFRPQLQPLAKDEVAVFADGKRTVYQVSENVAEAVKALDRESVGLLVKVLSLPSKLLRAGTTIVPEFAVRNPLRDQMTAMAVSKFGYNPLDFVRGMMSLIKKDDVFQDWQKSGGANATMVAVDRDYIQNNVFKLSQETGLIDRVTNVLTKPFELFRATSELMENSTRLGLFKKAQGGKQDLNSMFAAGMESKEGTLDFSRIGAKTRAMNMITAFFNAQIQGVDRVARAFKDDPMGMTMKVTAMSTLPSVLLWWANKDDERYKELPQWQKDLFWIVPTDKWASSNEAEWNSYPDYLRRRQGDELQVNKGNIWRIPKPFEIGLIFGSIPERALEAIYAKNPNAFKGLGDTLFEAFTPSVVPTAFVPAVEHWANRSSFTGKNIIPGALEGLLPEYQYTDYTSETAKLLGKFIAQLPAKDARFSSLASPAILENYIRGWSGNAGKYALQMADYALEKAGVVSPPAAPVSTLADMPVIKAFIVRYPTASTQSVQDFYDRYAKSEKLVKTVQHLAATGDMESAQKELLLKENQQYLVQLAGIKEALTNQMRMIRLIDRNPDIRPEEKRQMIDGLYFGMTAAARQGNELFKQTDAALGGIKK